VPRQATIEVLRTNLHEHPAVKAWSELQPERVEPEWIVRVQEESKKSSLYHIFRSWGRGGICPSTTQSLMKAGFSRKGKAT
jgi:hypothetical protein